MLCTEPYILSPSRVPPMHNRSQCLQTSAYYSHARLSLLIYHTLDSQRNYRSQCARIRSLPNNCPMNCALSSILVHSHCPSQPLTPHAVWISAYMNYNHTLIIGTVSSLKMPPVYASSFFVAQIPQASGPLHVFYECIDS